MGHIARISRYDATMLHAAVGRDVLLAWLNWLADETERYAANPDYGAGALGYDRATFLRVSIALQALYADTVDRS